MNTLNVIGEKYPGRISAKFSQQSTAHRAIEELIISADLNEEQIDLLAPGTADAEDKVEPETRGIRKTLVRVHVIFGALGLLAGLILAAVLLALGLELTRSSPVMTMVALGFFGTIAGLLLAGLVGLRPDHDAVVTATRRAAASGAWTLLVHTGNHRQLERAKALLTQSADAVSHSL